MPLHVVPSPEISPCPHHTHTHELTISFFVSLSYPSYTSYHTAEGNSIHTILERVRVLNESNYSSNWASLVAQLVKSPSTMPETGVRSLGWEDALEKGKATHCSIPSWRIPWTVYPMGRKETQLSDFHFTIQIIALPCIELMKTSLFVSSAIKVEVPGFPWWCSGWDSVLPKQGARDLIPGQGTRSHILQLKDPVYCY